LQATITALILFAAHAGNFPETEAAAILSKIEIFG